MTADFEEVCVSLILRFVRANSDENGGIVVMSIFFGNLENVREHVCSEHFALQCFIDLAPFTVAIDTVRADEYQISNLNLQLLDVRIEVISAGISMEDYPLV